ncbi:MAG: hypothetical protein H7Y20_16710, partial [Bryobacteraceae bacterium]|nr:hypothetical protein [Bryobacteraceae bacterium]
FGTPETYDPGTRRDKYKSFITPGVDNNRVAQCRQLRSSLEQAHEEGIPIPFGGWYPGTGNIGWGLSLTKERKTYDCDRAGLVDLTREPDNTLRRVLCGDLVKEVMTLREVGRKPETGGQPWTPSVIAGNVVIPAVHASGD